MTTDSEQAATTAEPPFIRRNYILGVINGALFTGSMRLLDAGGLFGLLLLQLTNSARSIGLISFFASVGWLWPAILVANMVEHRKRKLPYYQWSIVVRLSSVWAIAFMLFTSLPTTCPHTCYVVIAVIAFIESSACGVSYIPFMDIVGKSVPPAHRGRFLSLRMTFGEMLGFGTAAVAGYLLSGRSGYAFPVNFGLMVVFAAAIRTLALVSFSLVKEPERPVQRHRLALRMFLARGWRVFRRDVSFRHFTLLRVTFSLGSMALPFVAAFAKRVVGVSEATIATYMVVSSAAVLISNALWGRLGDRCGNRVVLRLYSAMAVLPSVLGLACAYIPTRSIILPILGETTLHVVLIGVVFFLAGIAGPGRQVGEANYILELAPETRRSTYLAFNQTIMVPLTMLPLFAGWIADEVSYGALFGIALLFSLLANLFGAVGLEEPRVTRMPRTGAGGASSHLEQTGHGT